MTRLALLLVCSLATTASADIWQRAIDDTATAMRDRYELALAKGDELALRANARAQRKTNAILLVDQAIAAYQEAANLRQDLGEPYFRIASVLESFFIDCDDALQYSQITMVMPPVTCPTPGAPTDPARMKQTLEAWDAFEARAPLDPRLASSLFQRAILRTKLVDGTPASRTYLEGALKDYLAILDRADGLSETDMDGVWGNLAETHMMLGRLEPAIEAYRTALRLGAGSSTAFGLAVALDRDESYAAAAEVIRARRPEEINEFSAALYQGKIFFVPPGEEFYYFALIRQVAGRAEDEAAAITYWKRYLASGAHPQYQARAKQHLAELQAKAKTQPPPKPTGRRLPYDPFDQYP